MAIFYHLEQLETPLENPVLTIGNFDGVHKGHLALFRKVSERAAAIKGESVVMTFDPHPIKIMRPGNGPPIITPTEQKLGLIDQAGIDLILCLRFTPEFASVSAQDFVRSVLVGKLGIRELVVGYDYSFGRGREGDLNLLRRMGEELGFTVHVLDPVRVDDTLVSSTSIRQLISQGKLAEAKHLLGRDYQICGTVVGGKHRGAKLLGYPTANLQLVDELVPKEGIYAVRVHIDDQTHEGLTNIGDNPTFGDAELSVETYILDFSGDLLGKTIKVDFLERIRDEQTFASARDLSEQIGRDVREAKKVFERREP